MPERSSAALAPPSPSGGTSDNTARAGPRLYICRSDATGSPSAANTLRAPCFGQRRAGALPALARNFSISVKQRLIAAPSGVMTAEHNRRWHDIDEQRHLGTFQCEAYSPPAKHCKQWPDRNRPEHVHRGRPRRACTIEVGGAGTFIAGGAVSAGRRSHSAVLASIVYIDGFEERSGDRGSGRMGSGHCRLNSPPVRILTQGSEQPVALTATDHVPAVGGRVARI